MFNADIGDIIEPKLIENPDEPGQWLPNPRAGSYKEIHEWPAVWRKMLSGSEVKELFEHSKDGAGASWDKIGELVKIKFIDPIKLVELIMRHRGVDGMAAQKQEHKHEIHISAEEQRELDAIARRRGRVIDVTAEEVKS